MIIRERYIYLASPYSHPDPNVMEERYQKVCEVAAGLFKQGHILFVPIAQCHDISKIGNIKGSWEFWQRVDYCFLNTAEALYVVTMDGWQTSKGVLAEIEFARQNMMPIRYVCPETLAIVKANGEQQS